MGEEAGAPRMRELPFQGIRRADVVGAVADVQYRRIRFQRGKGSRVRQLHLMIADGVPVEMIDAHGVVIADPPIPDDKLQKILACEVWSGVGTTWTPRACRATTYERAKRRHWRR